MGGGCVQTGPPLRGSDSAGSLVVFGVVGFSGNFFKGLGLCRSHCVGLAFFFFASDMIAVLAWTFFLEGTVSLPRERW